MLNLNLLRVFHEVADKQSVAKAAAALFVSQPAVSNALKRLQQESGAQLLYKSGRVLTLTTHGVQLYALTRQMFALEKQIETLLQGAGAASKQIINMGLATIYERFGVTEIKRCLTAFAGDVTLSIHSGNSQAVLQNLENHSIDLAVAGDVIRHPRFKYLFYKRHRLYLVIPKGHRLYGRKEFNSADLRNERMVLKEKGSSVRKTVDAYDKAFSIDPTVVMELSNIDSIFTLIAQEKCLALLPDLSISSQGNLRRAYSIARCTDTELAFSTYIVRHADGNYPSATRAIIEQFCAAVAEHGAKG